MNKPVASTEFRRFADSLHVVDDEVEITRRIPGSPVSACAMEAEKLRALATLISGTGFETFDGLDVQLKDNLMLLFVDIADCVANLAGLAAAIEG
jgi:hypothetical protein